MMYKPQEKICDRCEEPCDTFFVLPSDRRFRDTICWDCFQQFKSQYKRFMDDFMLMVERRRPWKCTGPVGQKDRSINEK